MTKKEELRKIEQRLNEIYDEYSISDIDIIFLDPKAWEAVGKSENWKEECNFALTQGFAHKEDCEHCVDAGWENRMIRMIYALISGKTIDEYLETL